ncbi:MAG: hypothetical protein WBK55_03220 [Alphaproteobacteria bacterium]
MINKIFRKIRNRLWDLSVSLAHFIHRLSHDYSYVDSIIDKYHPTGMKKDIFQPYKLWCLVKILEEHKPKKILEFGSGSSTVVFGDYARRNGAEVISVESDENWVEKAREFVAGNDNVKVIYSKAIGFADVIPPPAEIRHSVR